MTYNNLAVGLLLTKYLHNNHNKSYRITDLIFCLELSILNRYKSLFLTSLTYSSGNEKIFGGVPQYNYRFWFLIGKTFQIFKLVASYFYCTYTGRKNHCIKIYDATSSRDIISNTIVTFKL